MQTPLGVSVRRLVAGQVPDDEGLVARAGEEHVGAVAHQYCAQRNIATFGATYFSREVAREVTQPEWPSRVPRSTSCSAMITIEYLLVLMGSPEVQKVDVVNERPLRLGNWSAH